MMSGFYYWLLMAGAAFFAVCGFANSDLRLHGLICFCAACVIDSLPVSGE